MSGCSQSQEIERHKESNLPGQPPMPTAKVSAMPGVVSERFLRAPIKGKLHREA